MRKFVHICDSAQSLAEHARDWLVAKIQEHQSTSVSPYSVALSGGSTPKLLYRLLGELPEGDIDWKRVILVWGDERNVSWDHSDSNYRMVRESLLDHIEIPAENVLKVPDAGGEPQRAAELYEQILRDRLPTTPEGLPALNAVLLGIGDDVHTASLFPFTKALNETSRLVCENWVEKLDTWRITMTAIWLNSADDIAFLISGSGKNQALNTLWSDRKDLNAYPAQAIQPTSGRLWYLVDRDAVGDIPLPQDCTARPIDAS